MMALVAIRLSQQTQHKGLSVMNYGSKGEHIISFSVSDTDSVFRSSDNMKKVKGDGRYTQLAAKSPVFQLIMSPQSSE